MIKEKLINKINELSTEMRIYNEQRLKRHLIEIDHEEYVTNLINSQKSMLEKYHALYDQLKPYSSKFNYFDYGECILIVEIRNVVHHSLYPLKNWLESMTLHDKYKKYNGAEFLLANYDGYDVRERPTLVQIYFNYEDLITYNQEKKNQRQNNIPKYESDLSFKKIKEAVDKERYPHKQVYINIMPIILNALKKIYSFTINEFEIAANDLNYDGKVYFNMLTGENSIEIFLDRPIYKKQRIIIG